jgi:hypothetical protein
MAITYCQLARIEIIIKMKASVIYLIIEIQQYEDKSSLKLLKVFFTLNLIWHVI